MCGSTFGMAQECLVYSPLHLYFKKKAPTFNLSVENVTTFLTYPSSLIRIHWYSPMWGFLCRVQSFCLCRCTPHWAAHFSLLLCHLVRAVRPGSHGLLEHHHCWLMGILHHHISRSARGLGSQPPVKHNSISSVKHLQHVKNSSTTLIILILTTSSVQN